MLKGKNILITGASRGLGADLAKRLSENGANLVLAARSEDDLKDLNGSLTGGSNFCFAADLTEEGATKELVQFAISSLKKVDIVYHAIGGGLGLHNIFLAPEDLVRCFNLNVASVCGINTNIIPHMIENSGGTLVHVGSVASMEAHGSIAYNTCKAALLAYVKSLGREFVDQGIIATGVMPGGFHATANAMDRLKKNNPKEYEKYIKTKLPRKKMTCVEEILPIMLLLAANKLEVLSGCMIPLDAGEGKAY